MKISQVSERTGFSADTLRYYERIGLIAPIKRIKNGIREYLESDLLRIEFIKCMRQAGIPIKALNHYIALAQQGDETIEDKKNILKEIVSVMSQIEVIRDRYYSAPIQ